MTPRFREFLESIADERIRKLQNEITELGDENTVLRVDAINYRSRIRELEARFNKAQKSLNFFLCLVNESNGIAGWHLNGDIAPWGDWQDEIDAAFAAAGEPPR